MIGLLKKDFFILWHAYHKNLALVLVLYSVMALAMDLTFMVFFFAWISGFYILSGLTIDNYSKWDLYAASLPVSKRQIVGAKFILITLALLISFVTNPAVRSADPAEGHSFSGKPAEPVCGILCLPCLLRRFSGAFL